MSPCRAAPEVTRRGPNPRASDPAIASLHGERVIFCVLSIPSKSCPCLSPLPTGRVRERVPFARHNPGRVSRFQGARPFVSSHRTRAVPSPTRPRASLPFVAFGPAASPTAPRCACHLRAKNEKEASNPSIAGSLPARRAPERGKGPRRARGPGADDSPPTEPAIQRAHRLTRLPPVSSPRVAPFSIAFLVRFPSRRASSAETRAR